MHMHNGRAGARVIVIGFGFLLLSGVLEVVTFFLLSPQPSDLTAEIPPILFSLLNWLQSVMLMWSGPFVAAGLVIQALHTSGLRDESR